MNSGFSSSLFSRIEEVIKNTREIKLDEESKKIIQDYLIANDIIYKNEIDYKIVKDIRVFKDNENNYYFLIIKKYGNIEKEEEEEISITIHKKSYKQFPYVLLVLLIFLSQSQKQNQEISKEITKGIENIW